MSRVHTQLGDDVRKTRLAAYFFATTRGIPLLRYRDPHVQHRRLQPRQYPQLSGRLGRDRTTSTGLRPSA